jgi:cytochrome c oxidase cbb3-type subunit IV
MTYQILAGFAQTGGLLYFVALFVGIAIYAFWPRNRVRFDEAACLPLSED